MLKSKLIRCEACGRRWQVPGWRARLLRLECPRCRQYSGEFVTGTDLALIACGIVLNVLIWI